MKDLDAKKIAIVVIAILLVVGIITYFVKGNNKLESSSDSVKEKATQITNDYIGTLKLGNETQYLGVDLLYSENETKVEDLTKGDILNTAIRYVYAQNNGKYTIKQDLNMSLKANGYDTTKYVTIVDGESIRNAIKTLFDIDWKDTSYGIENEDKGYYTYEYENHLDCYLQSFNESYSNINTTSIKYVYTTIKDIKNNKKEVQVTVAVAYAFVQNNKQIFFSDSENNNKLYQTDEYEEEIREDYIDKLNTYTITYKIDGDNYKFESIKKN